MKDFRKILAAHKFTDEHGHRLENCQDFIDLVDAYEEEVLTKRGVEVVQKILRDKEPIMHAVGTPQTPGRPLALFERREWAEEWRETHCATARVAPFKVRLDAQREAAAD
jgi:hypothetical protein